MCVCVCVCIYIDIYTHTHAPTHTHTYIQLYIQGMPKKCMHTLTKESSMMYVSTNFNYTSQVEYMLQ